MAALATAAAAAAVVVGIAIRYGLVHRLRSSGAVDRSDRTKDELYDEAKRLNIEGRSSMTKQQLERAIARATS